MSQLPWLGVIGSFFAPLVFAASTQSLVITGSPATLDEIAETEISVSLTCTSCSTDSYLRGVFYPSGTSYFGFMQSNDGTWTNAPGSSCTQYYKVAQVDLSPEGTWSGKLKVKPDRENSNYNGPGEYLFKVGRYTPSCSSASTWSNEVTIAIIGPTHTPTPSMTPTPNPTSAPTNTPTAAPQPTATMGPTSTVAPTITPTSKPMVTKRPTPTHPDTSDILGISEIASEEAESRVKPEILSESAEQAKSGTPPWVFALLFVGVGVGLLAFAFAIQKVPVWKNYIESSRDGR